jgi:hypothetical protein
MHRTARRGSVEAPRIVATIFLASVILLAAGAALAQGPCEQPAVGGTVQLPPVGCDYLSPSDVHRIIAGLPPGTTIELAPIHHRFLNITETPGGNLGGSIETFSSSLTLQLTGTGELGGFVRLLEIPVSCEVHTGPRSPSEPVQDFDTEMVALDGQIFGDPDFDFLHIRAGSSSGLPPSPGHTTLTQLPSGNFNVDSFFDIVYTIDYQGAPGSVLEGMGGSTQGTIRMQSGQAAAVVPSLSLWAWIALALVMLGTGIVIVRRRKAGGFA